MNIIEKFNINQLKEVAESVAIAEELVCNFYKMSANQWKKLKYDVKTLEDLLEHEIVYGPFAQIIRYHKQILNSNIRSFLYYYNICLQDHSILAVLRRYKELDLFSFLLYVSIHELVHIVRFNKFLRGFDASEKERFKEEAIVHKRTCQIIKKSNIKGMDTVLYYYREWAIEGESFDCLML